MNDMPMKDATARSLQQLLANEFQAQSVTDIIAPRNALERCLPALLEALKWDGSARQIYEARPHLEPIGDIGTLRAVFARLGFRSTRAELPLARLSDVSLPVLVERATGPCAILAREPDGRLRVLCGVTGEETLETPGTRVESMVLFNSHIEAPSELQNRVGWFWHSLWHFRRPVAAIVFLTLLTNIVGLATPLYTSAVYNHVIPTQSTLSLLAFFASIAIVIGIEFYLRFVKASLVAYIGARFHTALANAAFEKVMLLPIAMVEGVSVATQISRFRQFEGVRAFFTGHLVNTMLDLPFVALYFAALMWVGGIFVIVPLALAAIYAALAVASIPITRRNVAATGQAQSQAQAFLIESLSRATTIRQLGAESIWSDRYRALMREAVLTKFRTQVFDSSLQSVSQGLSTLAGVGTLGVGTVMVMSGNLSMGGLIAIMMFIWRLLAPIQTAFLGMSNLGQFASTIRQVNALMRIAVERDPRKQHGISRPYVGRLTFDGIAHRYPSRPEPALRGVALDIPAGQIVAITGPAGAGKTTLLKMVLGFYQPAGGAVYLDGINVQQIDPGELRMAVGYVPQDPHFFFGTVAQNLALADPSLSEQEMLRSLADAGITDINRVFPQGLETKILGNARTGFGECARVQLALARAYAKKAPVYLLDDPGAYLDRAGDEALIAKLGELRGKATVLLVTARPSHIRACDRVIRLSRGMVMGQGAPEEMLKQAG